MFIEHVNDAVTFKSCWVEETAPHCCSQPISITHPLTHSYTCTLHSSRLACILVSTYLASSAACSVQGRLTILQRTTIHSISELNAGCAVHQNSHSVSLMR